MKLGENNSEDKAQYGKNPSESASEFTEKEVKKGNSKWRKVILIAIMVLAVALVALVVGLRYITDEPEVNTDGPVVHTSQPDENLDEQEADENVEALAEEPDLVETASRRDGTYTFAIICTDVESDSTDTILVGMLDTENGELNIVSIPRDTLVNTGYDTKKINYIYPANENNGKDGVEPLLETIADMLGYHVDSYALVDIDAAAQLVDAIGGVWFDVPLDMEYEDYVQNLYINIPAGYQLLTGEQAVQVFRYRYGTNGTTYAGGDIERIGVQQDLLMAIAYQVLSLGNISNMSDIISVYTENVETNVTTGNLLFYIQEFLKLGTDAISFDTLPANYYGTVYGVGYCLPYINDWLELVNEKLNPFDTEITRANIDMLYWDGESISGTQGYISGGIESFYGYDG